jgi:hypothetical protein
MGRPLRRGDIPPCTCQAPICSASSQGSGSFGRKGAACFKSVQTPPGHVCPPSQSVELASPRRGAVRETNLLVHGLSVASDAFERNASAFSRRGFCDGGISGSTHWVGVPSRFGLAGFSSSAGFLPSPSGLPFHWEQRFLSVRLRRSTRSLSMTGLLAVSRSRSLNAGCPQP